MHKFRHQADFVVEHRTVQAGLDKRTWPRFASSGSRCWLGWWQGGRPRIVPALVSDVSQGGAAISTEIRPPEGREIWLCPEASSAIGWIPGVVARVSSPGWVRLALGSRHQVGIRFLEHCVWESLRATLFGIGNAAEPAEGPPPLPGPGGSGS